MRLIKVENNYEIWYFSTLAKASRWINCSVQNVIQSIKMGCKASGYECEWIEADNVISKYIDPVPGTKLYPWTDMKPKTTIDLR